MRAVIYRASPSGVPGIIPIAGLSLAARQIRWLRSAGITEIAMELGTSPEYDQLASILADDVFGRDVRVLRSQAPRAPATIAEQAGLPLPLLAIPDHTIGDGDLSELLARAHRDGGVSRLPTPDNLLSPLADATVSVIAHKGGPPRRAFSSTGWGVQIHSHEDARVLSHAVLMGRLPGRDSNHRWPILVHAAETRLGVWLGRGATVGAGCHIEPPVHIGPGAIICSGARIGPNAFIGARAVLSRRARISNCFVTPDAMIGEGVKLNGMVVTPDTLYELHDATELPIIIYDRRVLARRAPAVLPPDTLRWPFTAIAVLLLLAVLL